MANAGLRVFTVFDCCHAGFGSALEVEGSDFAKQAEKVARERLLVTASQRMNWVTNPAGNPPSKGPSQKTKSDAFVDFGISFLPGSIPEFVHYGAARDQATALGDPKGSLFTRMFYRTIAESADTLNYVSFFKDLRFRLPARHTPVMETIPVLTGSSDGTDTIEPPKGHFSLTQNVLQI